MNKEDQQIKRILEEYRETLDTGKAVRAIKKVFGGLCLYGEDVPLQCYNCGEAVRPFAKDNIIKIHFDTGTTDTRITPGEPATVFVECENCIS